MAHIGGPRQDPETGLERGDGSAPSPRGAPRREPRQERARQTVRAILEAAAEIMAASGIGGATTNRIAERAGVSIGSLYQYFPNKQAILERLVAEHRADVQQAIGGVLIRLRDPSQPLDRVLMALFSEFVGLHQRKPDLALLLAREDVRTPAMTADHPAASDRLREGLAEVLAERPEVQVPDARLASYLLMETMRTLGRWLVHAVPGDLDRNLAAREVVRLVCGYLGVAAPPAGAGPEEEHPVPR
jgi:AcrR family transcriptional regulator